MPIIIIIIIIILLLLHPPVFPCFVHMFRIFPVNLNIIEKKIRRLRYLLIVATKIIFTKGFRCSASKPKLSTVSKVCDVIYAEKCKQTQADSSVSPVPFVLNIY